MAHNIQVIIAKNAIIEQIESNWIHAHKLPLKQGFSLIPMTRDLFDDITELGSLKTTASPKTNGAIYHWLQSEADLQQGSLAFIETDYFGGLGIQSAILFECKQPHIGPVTTESRWNDSLSALEQFPTGKGAINQILQKLGVVHKPAKQDEFDSLELGYYRGNDNIIKLIQHQEDVPL